MTARRSPAVPRWETRSRSRFHAAASWARDLVVRRRWCTVATLCMVVGATAALTLAVARTDQVAPVDQPFDGLPYGSATTGAPAPAPVLPATQPVVSAPAPPHTASAPVHRGERPALLAAASSVAAAPLAPAPATEAQGSRPGEPHLPAPVPSIQDTVGWLVPGVA